MASNLMQSCLLDLAVLSCAQERALTHAKELFSQADTDANGMLSVTELRDVLRTASKDYSHIEEHSRFLDGCVMLCMATSVHQRFW